MNRKNGISRPRPRVKTLMMCVGALMSANCFLATESRGQQSLDRVIDLEKQVGVEGAQSQAIVSGLSSQTLKLLEDFRATRQQVDNLRAYNTELQKLIAAQGKEMNSIEDQIVRASGMERDVVPLMSEMVETLNTFVGLDLPFLPEERRSRLGALGEMVARSDVATAEKYRRILEAYQVESEYGRTIEAYRSKIDLGVGIRTVDLLRVGRMALLYRTLDGGLAGYWDPNSRRWEPLPDDYEDVLRDGVMIARKQAAPDMLKVPVAAAPLVQ
jgi:hypothetical protein